MGKEERKRTGLQLEYGPYGSILFDKSMGDFSTRKGL